MWRSLCEDVIRRVSTKNLQWDAKNSNNNYIENTINIVTHTRLRVWLQSKFISLRIVRRWKNRQMQIYQSQEHTARKSPTIYCSFSVKHSRLSFCFFVVVVAVATTVIGIDSFDDTDFCWLDCILLMFVFGCLIEEGCTTQRMRFNKLQLTTNQANY